LEESKQLILNFIVNIFFILWCKAYRFFEVPIRYSKQQVVPEDVTKTH